LQPSNWPVSSGETVGRFKSRIWNFWALAGGKDCAFGIRHIILLIALLIGKGRVLMGTVHKNLAQKNVTRRQSLKTIGADVAGTVFAPNYLEAKGPITVRFADTATIDNPEYAGETFFAQRINEETKGAYQVKLFPNSVLGSDVAMNEQVRNGTIELVKSGQGEPPSYDKRLSILSLPYLYTSRDKLFAALDGKLGQAYAQISTQYGLINLGFFDSGIRSVYNTKGPFNTPEEFAALKLSPGECRVLGYFPPTDRLRS
jgi:hypothetical protein